MTTQLASQLQRLQQRPVGDKRLAQSFLFDTSDARSFSREQLHELAVHGLQTLIAMDNRFHTFLDPLFDPHRTRVERRLLHSDQNAAVDSAVESLLTLLSPHLFLAAAQQVFEYLVRVHEVHVHNPRAVLCAFLPYHDHSLFARAMMLLDVRDTGMDFLSTNQLHGAPLPREALVTACAGSRVALRLVCDALALSARQHVRHPAAAALFAGVAVRLATHAEAESHWRALMPYVVEFLTTAAREACGAALLVLAAWSAEVRLAPATLATVVRPIVARIRRVAGGGEAAPHTHDGSYNAYGEAGSPPLDLLALLSHLLRTQRAAADATAFTAQVQTLLALPWPLWAAAMVQTEKKETASTGFAAEPEGEEENRDEEHEEGEGEGGERGMYGALVALLLRYCLGRLGVSHNLDTVAPDVRRFLQCAVEELPLTNPLVMEVTKALVACHAHAASVMEEEAQEQEKRGKSKAKKAATKTDKEELTEDTTTVAGWLMTLERRFGRRFDAALSSLLRDASTRTAATTFLTRHLHGTRYELLEVPSSVGGAERLPLFACLLHPLPDVRLLAGQAMANMTAAQLTGGTASASRGNAPLALLEHVAAYEPCDRVAVQFIRTAAGAAERIFTGLKTNQTTTSNGEKKKEEAKVTAHLRGLVRALWSMISRHDASVRLEFLHVFIRPLLEKSESQTASQREVKTKKQKKTHRAATRAKQRAGGNEDEGEHEIETGEERDGLDDKNGEGTLMEKDSAEKEFHGLLLYYATLLYACASDANESALCEILSPLLLTADPSMTPTDSLLFNGGMNTKTGTNTHQTTSQFKKEGCLAIFDSASLLQRVSAEASARLSPCLRAVSAILTAAAATSPPASGEAIHTLVERPLVLECALATAATVSSSNVTSCDVAMRTLLDFFTGGGEYLLRLQDIQKANTVQRIGRAVTLAIEDGGDSGIFLPSDALTEAVGSALRRSLLTHCRLTASRSLDTKVLHDAEVRRFTQAAVLLCCLRTPLLPATVNMNSLPAAYLRLLDRGPLANGRLPIDWFNAVTTATYEAAEKSPLPRTSASASSSSPPPSSPSTVSTHAAEKDGDAGLALVLLSPLVATSPNARLATLRALQDAVLKPRVGPRTAARCIAASSGESVTTLSCIVEAMTLDKTERAPITAAAATLICRLVADGDVPPQLSHRALEHFFPVNRHRAAGATMSSSAASPSAKGAASLIAMDALLPALKRMLEGPAACPVAAADFLDAISRRLELCDAASLDLTLTLLRRPFLRIEGGGTRPVYRAALTALAHTLSYGIERQSDPLVFIANRTASKGGKRDNQQFSEDWINRVALATSQVLFHDGALGRIGTDAARFLVTTSGGYHRLFLPYITSKTASVEVVADTLEALAVQDAADVWESPARCTLHSPLRIADARRLVALCSQVSGIHSDNDEAHAATIQSGRWLHNETTAHALRLLSGIFAAASSIRCEDTDQDEDEGENEEMEKDSSLFSLVDSIVEGFPLPAFLPLLTGDDSDVCHRRAIHFLRDLVHLCVSSPLTLDEGRVGGAAYIIRSLVKQFLVLMADLLASDTSMAKMDGVSTSHGLKTNKGDLSHGRIETIAVLLRILSPLLMQESTDAAALHIPVLALLIRLESVDFASAHHQHTSAIDACESVITSLDAPTQLTCLAQMIKLLIDPHGHLAGEGDAERLFRRLVKPNQVINRQETILHLINTTIKSESFLSGFLTLQFKSKRTRVTTPRNSTPSHAAVSASAAAAAAAEEDEDADDGEEEDKEQNKNAADKTNDACMNLLVAALELFAHYNGLRHNAGNAADDHEEAELFELLAGNTLACVLAGIDEITFVRCLERLLSDSRLALQQKGLEVLLDRLHNALPALEHTVSDAELEAHRRRLRDPRVKLALVDLVRVKARPRATKRTFDLFPQLLTLLQDNAAASRWNEVALSVACAEELVRIVAGGGSLQAEKTLLNVDRAGRVTAATLAKLFGNSSRVRLVHRWFDEALSLVPTLLKVSGAPDGALCAAAALLSALGTLCQAMGATFALEHATKLVSTTATAAADAAGRIPPTASRGAAGSLLRRASLGCLLRALPSCWTHCAAHLPRVLYAAVHRHNADDPEAHSRAVETLAVLEAAIDPRVLLEACTVCLQGPAVTRMRADTHALPLLFAMVRRRVEGLPREHLQRMAVLMDTDAVVLSSPLDGNETTATRGVNGTSALRGGLWLAALQTLAAAPSPPPGDVVLPILEAYTAFFVKFKSKQCVQLLSAVATWAFADVSEKTNLSHAPSSSTSHAVHNGEDAVVDISKRKGKRHGKDANGQKVEQHKDDDGDDDDANNNDAIERERNESAIVPRVVLHRWLLFYALCTHMLEHLGPILDFGFPVMLPHIVSTLNAYCGDARHAMPHAAGLVARTLEGALDAVRRIARAQTAAPDADPSIPTENILATPEVFNAVMPAVVRQLTNLTYLADGTHDFAFRAEQHAIPAARALFHSLASTKLQSKTQKEVVKTLRHPSRHVRWAALRCLDGIYADGGDELAARLMAEMLPAVVEMTEDRHDEVVEAARQLCGNLSQITGQDVLYAMSAS